MEGIGFIPVYGFVPKIADFIIGKREINDNSLETVAGITSDAISIVNTLADFDLIRSSPLMDFLGPFGTLLDAVSAYNYLDTYFFNNDGDDWKLEEAIGNQFNRDVWVSTSRQSVINKWIFVKTGLSNLVSTGELVVMKASDYFETNGCSPSVSGSYYYAPDYFTGLYRNFDANEYYVFPGENYQDPGTPYGWSFVTGMRDL